MKISRIVLLTGFSAALVFAQGQGKHLGASQAGGLGGFGLSETQLDRLAEFLDLSDQQLQDAKAILEQARADEDKLGTQVQDLQQQIQDLVRKSTTEFDAQIQTLLSSYTAAEGQELAIRLKAMNRFWNLLTSEQQQKANDLDKFLKPPAGNSAAAGQKGNNGKGNGKGNGNN